MPVAGEFADPLHDRPWRGQKAGIDQKRGDLPDQDEQRQREEFEAPTGPADMASGVSVGVHLR